LACRDDDFGRIIKLLMLTGQRRLEIGHLEWAEIFAERRQIELPAARTKNKRPHMVPLSTAARRGSELPHWTVHDLRRSFATHVNELGFAQPHVTEAILNHVSGAAKSGVAGIYNRAMYLAEKRQALEQWAAYLTGLVAGPLTRQQSNSPEKSDQISTQLASGTQS
jgi:integrase